MKRTRLLETLVNIKVNIVAFVSVALFVGLGIAVFLGIRWGGDALRVALQDEFARTNTHDIEIMFPYGLSESDLSSLRSVEGVSDVEAGYSTFVTIASKQDYAVLKVQSLTERIDSLEVLEGRKPENASEICLLKHWADKLGISVGDTVSLRKGDSSSGLPQLLKGDSFKVVGLAKSGSYLNVNSSALGFSSANSGTVDCVGYVTRDAFDASLVLDGYTNAYVRCESLDSMGTFRPEYGEACRKVIDRISELSATLAPARFREVRDDAATKVGDARSKLEAGESALSDLHEQLESGEQAVADGQAQIADGEQALAEGKALLAEKRLWGEEQLAEAQQLLEDKQSEYDAGQATYEGAKATFDEFNGAFEEMRPTYEALMELYFATRGGADGLEPALAGLEGALDAWRAAPEDEKGARWAAVEAAYAAFGDAYGMSVVACNTAGVVSGLVAAYTGGPAIEPDIPELPEQITPENADAAVALASGSVVAVHATIDAFEQAQIGVGDVSIPLTDISSGLDGVAAQLEESRVALEAAREQLDAGWAQYQASRDAYDAAVADGWAEVVSGQAQLDASREQLAAGERQLAEGRGIYDEKSSELERGRDDVSAAQRKLDAMDELEWVVTGRHESAMSMNVRTLLQMIDSACWAMALLFILVGLFVCYSALARLVHEQVTQIGTKKALGFTSGEVASGYLLFSGAAVLVGAGVGAVLSVVLVQGVMNPAVIRQFLMGDYAPYFNLGELGLMTGLELALILASTWFAIRSVLARQAVDLLSGESNTSARHHFFEDWAIWRRMSLYSQTIVNNCVNDRRRVVGTLVGVVGCTALIVTAVTLSDNVAKSIKTHYERVCYYDTVVYAEVKDSAARETIEGALREKGLSGTPVAQSGVQVRKADGSRGFSNVIVPLNEDDFSRIMSLASQDGTVRPADDGLWVCAGFASHNNLKVGDEVTMIETTGKTHAFKVAGVFDSYIMRSTFVLGASAYRDAFGDDAQANAFLVDRGGGDMSRVRDAMANVSGYDSAIDDRYVDENGFAQMNNLLNTVVMVYLLLSALMALMVLLNLYTMFVDEKKRELIVLMICGYSVREAKAYIYRDSIALTAIGIVLGIALGSALGILTTRALEPETGFFLKNVSLLAVAAGIVGTSLFSAVVLLMSLRRIGRFDLTDINRF